MTAGIVLEFFMPNASIDFSKLPSPRAIWSRLRRIVSGSRPAPQDISYPEPKGGIESLLSGGVSSQAPRDNAERYIDLMIRILTNTIYEDSSIVPGQTPDFDRKRRATGLDWPARAHSMAGTARLRNVVELVEWTLRENIPGDYIETGVWRGGCSILMRAILAARDETGRRVYLADSFEGLPPPKPDLYPQDKDDTHHAYPQLAISLEQVKENFSRYGLLDDQVRFVKGFFDQTLPKLEAGPFALLRLDGDMYESTIVALKSLYPRLSPGGFVIIDDYGLKGCRLAVDDYRREHGIVAPLEGVDWTGVWWRKPLEPQPATPASN